MQQDHQGRQDRQQVVGYSTLPAMGQPSWSPRRQDHGGRQDRQQVVGYSTLPAMWQPSWPPRRRNLRHPVVCCLTLAALEQPSWGHHADPKDNIQDQHDHQDDQDLEEILEAEACT